MENENLPNEDNSESQLNKAEATPAPVKAEHVAPPTELAPSTPTRAERIFTKGWVVAVCAIICCLLWGSAFPCVKIGYRLFEIDTSSAPSLMLFAGTRFSLAGILVIIFGSIQQKKFLVPKPKNIWRVLIVALFQTAMQYTFFYIGLANTTGVKSAVLN